METSEEDILKKCRICDVSTDEDFVTLFTISSHIVEKTYSGELFDELIQLPSTEDPKHPYICSGCDLQMKLFKRLKDKAWKKLIAKNNTNQIKNETFAATKSVEDAQAEENDTFLTTNSIEYEVENENIATSDVLESYFEDTADDSRFSDVDQTENIENNNILIVYDVKGQSLQSVNIDDLIELENCEGEVESDSNGHKDAEHQSFFIANANCNDDTTENSHAIEAENEEIQMGSNDDHDSSNCNDKLTENRSKSIESECMDCGLFFPSVRSFKIHRQEQHGRTHLCKICQKLFKTAENLEGHMRQHQGLPPYECNICNRTFNQKVHYQYHMKKHANERDFACDLCDKNYLNKSDLTMHIKRVHEDKKYFICSFRNCDKRFYNAQHLKYHSYVHSKQKNFECDKCMQKFVAPNALALHKKTMHNSGIRFACTQCGKTFRRKHHLLAHSSVHKHEIKSSNFRENNVLNRKIKILKTNSQTECTSLKNTRNNDLIEIDESTLQTMNDQSDDNDFLMDAIECCSETNSQNAADNFNFC